MTATIKTNPQTVIVYACWLIDAWAEADSGWVWNSKHAIGTTRIAESATDDEIMNHLVADGVAWADEAHLLQIEEYGCGCFEISYKSDGMPLLALIPQEWEGY